MTERVRFEVDDDGVGQVTLARADKLNAMDWAMFEALHDVAGRARAAAEEGRCRAVLVVGEGRAFSAGLDVSLFAEQAAGNHPDDERIAWLQQAFTNFEDLPVPTVAAVAGVALGAGCQLGLACHLRVVAPDAGLGLLEVRWGLVPDLGATWRLPRLVGLGRATDLAVSGRRIDAETAVGWGLADALLADEDFAAAAHAYAAGLAAGPTTAVGALPRLLRDSLAGDRGAVLAAERRAQAACLASEDFAEAAKASLEGRDPSFSGR